MTKGDGGYVHSIASTGYNGLQNGITRRDWLAGLAMQGLLANGGYSRGVVAEHAYNIADELIIRGKL